MGAQDLSQIFKEENPHWKDGDNFRSRDDTENAIASHVPRYYHDDRHADSKVESLETLVKFDYQERRSKFYRDLDRKNNGFA